MENEVEAVVRMGGSLRGGEESLRKNEIDKRGRRREIIKKKIERKRERTFFDRSAQSSDTTTQVQKVVESIVLWEIGGLVGLP